MATRTDRQKNKRRLKKRRGNVIFVEGAPDGMKDWLVERAERNQRTISGEVITILDAARKRDARA